MRKLHGAAAAEDFGGGKRLVLTAATGERVSMDLSADAAAELAGQLQPAPHPPADSPVKPSMAQSGRSPRAHK